MEEACRTVPNRSRLEVDDVVLTALSGGFASGAVLLTYGTARA
jgi:hypothetical protein